MPLTDTRLRALKPKTKPYKVADERGLYIEVTPAGGKHWRFRYRIGKAQKKISLGSYASGRRIRSAVNDAVQTGLLASGQIGPEKAQLAVLERVNTTYEELRHVAAYQTGRILEVSKRQKTLGLMPGQYRTLGSDPKRKRVTLENARGKKFSFDPSRIRADKANDSLALFNDRQLEIHRGDKIRWTRNDHKRGLFNAGQAKVIAIDKGKVTVETSKGEEVTLGKDDPMLKRIDLAYALNAHMAQGLTSDRGIAVMVSRERNLSNQKTFLVTVTRLRDHLTLVLDSSQRLTAAVAINKGEKASALEVTSRLRAAATKYGDAPRQAESEKNTGQELERIKRKTLDRGI
tara:strand:+ start:200 stop:1237 length:1038 start_codon:yes stop_codon:yes gene_type:complete